MVNDNVIQFITLIILRSRINFQKVQTTVQLPDKFKQRHSVNINYNYWAVKVVICEYSPMSSSDES